MPAVLSSQNTYPPCLGQPSGAVSYLGDIACDGFGAMTQCLVLKLPHSLYCLHQEPQVIEGHDTLSRIQNTLKIQSCFFGVLSAKPALS